MGEVGTAYLTVEPKLSSDFGSKTAQGGLKDGQGYGSKFSSAANKAVGVGMVALGNILASAATAAASAAGQAFADMIQGAMDYEQLAGGVEKIFDQANIDGILQDANNAYKDLNMSANEYLASINQTGAAFAQTMGDQKGYDIARTGMKAIADYASGTGRNLDELNDKYALITRSTSSYQSIADQFSGILPATSKDFLEQAQAAGYLSDSYKSLTDVPIAEYQEAVTMMLEKGVTDMGLYGNTAMESAETMSGSLAMLKASWSNMLTSILDENADLSESFGHLLESIGAVVSNFAPRIGLLFARLFLQLPQALLDAIMALPDTLLPALQAVFGEQMGQSISDNMRSAFGTAVTTIGEMMVNIMNAIQPIIDGIVSLFQEAWPIVSQIVYDAMTFVGGVIESVWPVIVSIIEGAMNTVSQIIQTVWPYIQNIVVSVMRAVQLFMSQVWPAIKNTIQTTMTVIKAIIDVAWPAIQSMISNAVSVIKAIIDVAWPAIQNIVTTVMNAIKSVTQTVWPAIQGIISGAVAVIESVINGMQSVVATVTGIFNGVKSAIEGPMNAAKDFIGNIVDTIKGFFNFQISWPHIPLPHFSVSGSANPLDWLEGGVPSFSVSWYASGGIVDGATLIGAGEAGPEMILPKNGGLMTDFAEAVASADNDEALIRWLSRNLGTIIADNAPTISRRDFDRMARSAVA